MKFILDFFKPPVFPNDEDKTLSAYYLHMIVLISMPVISVFLIIRLMQGESLTSISSILLIGIIGLLIIVYNMTRNGQVRSAGHLHISAIWIISTILAITGNGTKGTGAASYFVVVALAGLVLGYRTALTVTGFSIFSMFGLAAGETLGFIVPREESAFSIAVQMTVLLIFASMFTYLSLSSLQKAIVQAKKKGADLEKSNRALKELQKSLENKIQERTDNLSKANQENKRRAGQFQTVAQIAQKIASERDLETLLSVITDVISSQFNYYHVAVYLNDDGQEYTILSAASSEEGKLMMEHAYKLPIEPVSLIGYVAKTGNSRIHTDTMEENTFNSLSLSESRSEFALALKIGSHIVGVLDVQSKEHNAFDDTDIEALTALANQITIAIQNTRLFAETQTALAESQLLYGTVVKQTWRANMQAVPQIGYRYTGVKPIALEKEINTPEILDALDSGDIAMTHPSKRKNENSLAVPLKLREATVGVINISLPVENEVGEDEIEIIREASQRIAIALENASLLEESQRRAKREQNISEMSTKISSGTDIETILKTAIRELGAHIAGAQILVELGNEGENE